MIRRWLAYAAVSGVAACATPAPAGGTDPPSIPPAPPAVEAPRGAGVETFDAVVHVEAQVGDKKFQGVWLERDGGERLIVAYRPEGWLRAFEGRRVIVSGEHYVPEGQAIMAPHFRVQTIRLRDVNDASKGASLVAVGPERALTGRFVGRVGAPQTKLEGERYLVFEAEDGTAYLVEHAPDAMRAGPRVRVRARAVEASPFVARRGGPSLWVLDAAPVE